MIVGMSDLSYLPGVSGSRPGSRPVEPTAPNFLGSLLRAANPLARRNDVSGSLMKPTATTLANANAPFTTGAIAERGSAGLGDVAKDLGMYAVGGAVGSGVGRAVQAAVPYLRRAAYASNSPAVQTTLANRHFGPENLSLMHPRDVPVVDARTAGPGTYFATPSSANSLRLRLPGDRSTEYGVPLSFMDRYKLASSQGYAGREDVAKAIDDLGIADELPFNRSIQPLNEATFDDSIVQDLLRKGFIGFDAGKNSFPSGEVTNWLVGANDIGRINRTLPQLRLQSGPADVDSIPRLESILRRFFPQQ